MKKAYYEVVKTEEEKLRRDRELREMHKDDSDFYSVYVDCDIKYNEALSNRKSFQALMSAVRRKKVDTILISSFEAFHVSELYALTILLRFKERGVKIQVGTEESGFSNSVSRDEIISKMYDIYEDYLFTVVSVPMITMAKCFILKRGPFIFLEKDKEQAEKRYSYAKAENGEKKLFVDAIEECHNDGFFFFRSDVDEWYHIDACGVEILRSIYKINNDILFEEFFEFLQE